MSSLQPMRQRGLSLIELMIALLIGSILLVGVIQVFSASRTAYQLSDGLARTQENARFAVDYLQRDTRMGGHWGCVSDQSHLQTVGAMVNHIGVTDGPLNFAVSVQGFDAAGTAPTQSVTIGAYAGGWSPGLPTWLQGLNPSAGSDILVLRFLSNQGAPINAISGTGPTTFTVPATRWTALTTDGVASPRLFGVADCSYVDIFQASNVNAGAGTVQVATNASRYTAQPSGQTVLYRAESLVYYVAPGAGGQRSLWRARHNGTSYASEELVEGVESLQLLYGLDRTPDLTVAPPSGYIDVYQPASAITTASNWRRVGAVQIGMVMSSPDSAAATAPAGDDAKVRALGVTFEAPAASDGRFRTSYETTVALRNRLFGN